MQHQENYTALISIRRKYVQAKLLLYSLQSLALALVGIAILLKWGRALPVATAAGAGVLFVAVGYVAWRWHRLRQVNLQQVARHLDRTYPQLEDSSALLLQPAQNLHFLARLQQQKIGARVAELVTQQEKVYQIKPTLSYLSLGIALVLSVGIIYLPASPLTFAEPTAPIQIAFPDVPDSIASPDAALAIEEVKILISPPAYTGKKPYKADAPNLRVEQGARVSWQVKTNRPTATLELILNETTTLRAANEQTLHLFSQTFTQPALYHFNLNGQKSAYYTLEVIPDEAPAIQITKPEQYTEVLFGEAQQVTLQAQLSDDYGIREANMVATVAKGTGEAVKFREEKIKLSLSGNNRAYQVNQTLDLQQLGMTYGDELYFYLQAWDNHKGYTRSESFFVKIEDTTIVESMDDFAMGVNPVPEYFRSQRQIIIDTEKLVKEQKGMARTAFENKSDAIGVDQKLLRLRYGKFLGEEFESGIGPGGGIPEGEAGHHAGDGHDHPEFKNQNSAEALLDPYMHKHDQEEAATFFEPAVKVKLKGALAQMWEAELRLRTHKPKEALPFEYKALRMLKEVQQSTRAYAAKTGFEAPPLKEQEKRLTGELTKITAPSGKRSVEAKVTLPYTRAALQWLEKQKQSRSYTTTDASLLERAGQELAQEALHKPGRYLRAMQDLRTLIQDVRQNKALCRHCLASIEQAWYELLPPAKATPQKQSTSRSSLSQHYLNQLKSI
ncbi:DUF4175 domain-containing protein [Pontibacter sp. SGAir0037]|uniref:DUF4175 domain-containing protein n=1 Tax=Pontibacter sp. SGAir0037 TaxID=2571030 RepID=UPI0010F66FE4|nr:DUF4175 domain-containing protein [Pontibacter sp. SGAir0037]